ncbi:hypothetical protein B9Z55_014286 [Caenorhabditis nigoni]|uniref:Uncharacterized protein n=1 Tax=Caenorhabditis nigoni TaxID=1611254 RepID=A0A2G5U5A0_9PELO|nr:hypothetical protein B9Z55_014286 [Caenorhabditis nigoni]
MNMYGNFRKPRQGSCLHMICQQCQTQRNSAICEVCGREDAFREVWYNYDLIRILEEMVTTEEKFENLQKNPQRIGIGSCSNCHSDECLRFCLTCAETRGFLQKLSNGTMKIIGSNKSLQLMAMCFVCANCIGNEHHDRDHETKRMSDVKILEKNLKLWTLLVQGLLLERQLKEKKYTGNQEYLRDLIDEYKKDAIDYSIFLSVDNLEIIEDNIKKIEIVDIHQLPELSQAKENSFQMAKGVHLENRKLKERILMYRREEISAYHELVLKKLSESGSDEELEGIGKELAAMIEKYKKIKVFELEAAEVERIDKEAEEKLEELLAFRRGIEPTDADIDPQFLKYRAIKKESERLEFQMEEAENNLIESYDKLHDFVLERLETINYHKADCAKWIDSETAETTSSSLSKIVLYELNLMMLRHFHSIPYRNCSDKIYVNLLGTKENDSFMRDLLHATAFI